MMRNEKNTTRKWREKMEEVTREVMRMMMLRLKEWREEMRRMREE